MTPDDDLRLAAANPVPEAPVLPGAVVAAAVGELLAVPRGRVRRRRRPRRRTALLGALAALVLVPGAAAGMEAAGIHTGFFPGPGDTESTPGEEYLDSSAAGIVDVVRDLTTEFTLPAGEGWAPLLARWPSSESVYVQRSGIGMEVEWYARCRWEAAWLRAHAAGDAAAAAAAARVLADPASSRYAAANDGGGVMEYLRGTAAAAAAGDPARVRQEYRANCR